MCVDNLPTHKVLNVLSCSVGLPPHRVFKKKSNMKITIIIEKLVPVEVIDKNSKIGIKAK